MASPFPLETVSHCHDVLQHLSLTEITTVLVRVDNEQRYLLQRVACKKTNLIAVYTAVVK
jgi:hypothetical protein